MNIISRHTQPLVFGSDLEISGAYGGAAALPCYWLQYDGAGASNDYVSVNPAGGQVTGNALTIEAWMYLTNSADYSAIARRSIGASNNYALYITPGAAGTATGIFYTRHAVAVADNWILPGLTMTLNAWHHIAATFDGANKRFWIDGNLVGTTPRATALEAVAATMFYVGSATATGTYVVRGRLAHVRISNSVRYLAPGPFATPLSPFTTDATTVLLYNFRNEGGAGVTADDESANLNDGAFKGAGEPAWGGTMAATGPAGWSDV